MSRRVWHVCAWTEDGGEWDDEVAAKSRRRAIAIGIARSGLMGRVHATASWRRVTAKGERQWERRYWRLIRQTRVVRRAGVEVQR